MERRMGLRRATCALATVVTLACVGTTYAQTQGMERRDERQDDKAGARAAKQECKAGDENTRAECRQVKHETKQEGRGRTGGATNEAPAAPANPAQ